MMIETNLGTAWRQGDRRGASACGPMRIVPGGLAALAGAFLSAVAFGGNLTDNFDVSSVPTTGNDCNLNEGLALRQGGTLAPRSYRRIAGPAEWVRVNHGVKDPRPGRENGFGKLVFLEVDYNAGTSAFSAVELDLVEPGYDVTLKANVSPVINNAAMDSGDWVFINMGASGGDGYVSNHDSGVGMTISDKGECEVYNQGRKVARGTVPPSGSYSLEISLTGGGSRYSLSINGQGIVVVQGVTATGKLIQLGGNGTSAPAGQPYPVHTLDDLSIAVLGARLNGDVNGSGRIDLSDAVYTLNFLFMGGPKPVSMVCSSIERFRDNGDGTVTDTTTKLLWQKDTAPGAYNWNQASILCVTWSFSSFCRAG